MPRGKDAVARDPARPRTVGELRRRGYEPRTVKREIRDNLRRVRLGLGR